MNERVWQLLLDSFWQILLPGIRVTIPLTLVSFSLGLIIALLTAMVQVANIPVVKQIARIYVWIIRGTPLLVQLFLIFYGLPSVGIVLDAISAAIIVFSFNTGAYASETVRAAIEAVPAGQLEAGRSLGFNYSQTMWYIIMPQAFKNVLPALCNEFIALLKETSVAGYIALQDLTKGGDIIRSRTYDAFMPLLAVALIYLILVIIFTKLIQMLERRLRQSER